MESISENYLQLEIRSEAVMELINRGVLSIEDVRALNRSSGERVRALLLGSICATSAR